MHTMLPPMLRDPAAESDDALACLQASAAPAVLRVLDTVRIPARIDDRLRGWLGRVMAGDAALALELDEVAQAYRDLSTLYLSCCSYALSPTVPAQAPITERVVMTDRGGAVAVSMAQACTARIARARHGDAGARAILAAIGLERARRRQICEMVAGSIIG